MKLSTAMRIGSMTTKKIKDFLNDGNNGRCAMGAVLDASGILNGIRTLREDLSVIDKAKQLYPILDLRSNGILKQPFWDLIAIWNNETEITREEIANKIEQVEEYLGSLEEKQVYKEMVKA